MRTTGAVLVCVLGAVSGFSLAPFPAAGSTRRMHLLSSRTYMCAKHPTREDEASAGRRLARRSAVASVLAPLIAMPVAARAQAAVLANKSPNEVVQYLLDALAKNDTPAPDAGLKTFVSAASPANPATANADKFISVIKTSPYSILLGKYDSMRMAKANEGILKSGNYGATVTIRLDSTVRKFAALGVDQKFLFAAEEDAKQSDSATEGDQDSKLFVIMEFQLSKDVATKAWMVDSVYFVPLEAMRA